MKPIKNTEKLIKKLSDKTGKEMDERVLKDVLQAFGDSEKIRTKAAGPDGWKIIVKSPIKAAAAAVAITAIIIAVYFGHGDLDITTTAFGRIREALTKVTWMHTVHIRHVRDKGRTERWILYDPATEQVNIDIYKYEGTTFDPKTRSYGGHVSTITVSNRFEGTRTHYDYQTNTKSITYLPKLFGFSGYTSPQSLVENFLKNFMTDDEVTRERSGIEGVDVDIYLTRKYITSDAKNKQIRSEFKLVVDRNRNLPLATSYKFWQDDGTLFDDRETQYYYPITGPNNIDELGVPESPEVLDFPPTSELTEAIANYHKYRDESPLRYIAVLVQGSYDASSGSNQIGCIDRHYCDDYLQRADASWFKPVPQQQFYSQAGNSLDSILKWWADKAYEQLDMSHEYLDLYGEECQVKLFRPGDSKDWQIKYKGYNKASDRGILRQLRYIVDRDVLSELGWPRNLRIKAQGSWKITVADNEYSRSKNLICIEILGKPTDTANRESTSDRSLFYLNPQRDYICQRCEFYPAYNYVQDREVLEFGRLDSGQWYPKKILERTVIEQKDGTSRQTDELTTVYLDTNPEFPEGIFEPERLLK